MMTIGHRTIPVDDELNSEVSGLRRWRELAQKTPECRGKQHGSWLNIAECELSCLTRQCLSNRRIGELADLQSEITTWSDKTNAKQRGVDWQFRINDARIKLKRLYPKSRLDEALAD